MKKIVSLAFITGGFFILIPPTPAFANAGLPMVWLTFPMMILALAPIVLIEAKVIEKILAVKKRKTILASFVANLLTTLIGIPLSWGLLLGISRLVVGGGCASSNDALIVALTELAVLCPNADVLAVIISFTICFLTAFLLSLLIEYAVIRSTFKEMKSSKVKQAVLIGNTITYTLLISTGAIYIFIATPK